ncbi:carbamoyl phosphate synthase small subunit [Harryflintia acetispora]|uniref:Carbamoyl-phosphate synthase small subunit n=1 Tax=Harryflintia acetispora TaxID=1849041 RepID=A0A9X8UJL7_9FIRM|nr:carbamoyl phosphate synthase small subunit [Harryflintia acetispora]TCL43058.1 carbamoyl-phosphate synthase small subunit [Harryflintia acetispora]
MVAYGAQRSPAWLVLEDGRVIEGVSFGAKGEQIGRLVFNTACVGYQQMLTDPDSLGQIVVQAFPCIGNYGVNGEDFESPGATVHGLLVREWCEAPSNFRMSGDIGGFMKEQGIVGMCGIDTRALVRAIRDGGEQRCLLTTERPADLAAAVAKIKGENITDGITKTTCDKMESIATENDGPRLAVLDLGCKRSFLDSLRAAGFALTVCPAGTKAQALAGLEAEGVVLSSGPEFGVEPGAYAKQLEEIYKLGLPILAVGLGHVLLGAALGGKVGALTHGHRGANIPVTDLRSGRTVITSQNHGLILESVGAGEVSHRNLSDGSCEGVRYPNAMSVAFIPAYERGHMNTGDIFRAYRTMVKKEEK